VVRAEMTEGSRAMKHNTFNPYVARRLTIWTSILDVGCASGRLGATMRIRGNRAILVGIERDAEAAERAKQHYDEVIVGDIEQGALDELHCAPFDVIVCADVLGHLKRPDKVLERLRVVLAEDGKFVISVANVAFASTRLSLLFGQFNYRNAGGILEADHLRHFTRKSLKTGLAHLGLEVTYLRGYNLVRPRFYFLKVLGWFWPTLFCVQFLAEAKKAQPKRVVSDSLYTLW